MDNNRTLDAQADMEEHFRQRPSTQSSKSYIRAQEAARIAAGGIGSTSPTTEESPLLANGEANGHDGDPPAYEPQNLSTAWPGMSDFDGLPWYKTPSVYWMLPCFLIFSLAFGAIIVPKLNLVRGLICRDYYSHHTLRNPFDLGPLDGEEDPCDAPAVQRRATFFSTGEMVIGGILTALTAPHIGAMADRYGRTRIMAITSAGGLAREIFLIFAANYLDTFPVGLLYVGFVVDGLCGSVTAGMAVAHAYASDTTPPARRNVAFGYFHVCLFTGIAAGPIIGGYISKATGTYLTMFYVAFACHVSFIIALLFIIPESLPKWRQKASREKHRVEVSHNPTSSWLSHLQPKRVFAPLKVLYPTGEGSTPALRRNLISLVVIDTIIFGCAMGMLNIFLLYVIKQFKWNLLQQSEFVSVVNSVRVTTLFIVLPVVNRVVRGPRRIALAKRASGCDGLDLALIRVGVGLDCVGILVMASARTGALFILGGCIAALGGIASPTMQSAQTKHVPHHRVGQLLGATGMLHSISRIIAPLLFSAVYGATVGHYNQAVFFVLFGGFFISFLLTWLLRAGVYLDETNEPSAGVTEDADVNGEVGRIIS